MTYQKLQTIKKEKKNLRLLLLFAYRSKQARNAQLQIAFAFLLLHTKYMQRIKDGEIKFMATVSYHQLLKRIQIWF